MSKITLRTVAILSFLALVFLGLGRWFDSRCEKSCLEAAFNNGIKVSGNSLNLKIGDMTFDSGDKPENDVLNVDGPKDIKLGDLAAVELIELRAVSTNFTVGKGAALNLRLYNFGDETHWTIVNDGKKIFVEVKPGGAERAEIAIPETYKGSISVSTVSGEVVIDHNLNLKNLTTQSASGDIRIDSLPREMLELNSVSGEATVKGSEAVVTNKVNVQSISGDINLDLKGEFKTFFAHTVSGSVHLNLPKSRGFTYKMHAISGDFEGLPTSTDTSHGFGTRSMNGTYGQANGSSIEFDTVSGTFTLDQKP